MSERGLRDDVADTLQEVCGRELEGTPEQWLALADAAIVAIEYSHTLLPSAGLMVAVYSDGVLDFRWEDETDEDAA